MPILIGCLDICAGTPLGDPIEVGALAAALVDSRPADSLPLLLTAAKTWSGHAEPGAGVQRVAVGGKLCWRQATPFCWAHACLLAAPKYAQWLTLTDMHALLVPQAWLASLTLRPRWARPYCCPSCTWHT